MKTLTEPTAKAEIISRIAQLAPDARRRWGKMDVHQMVCHLCDSHLLVMGEMTAADKSNVITRSVIRIIALRVPITWPKGASTVPELDQAAGGGTRPAIFEADRARLIELIHRFTAPKRDFSFAHHPMFAAMSEWEWMRWAYLHADHHLRQFGL